MTCPRCDEDINHEPAYMADPANNVQAWPGGYRCGCGWEETYEEPEPFDAMTGPWPERESP